MKIYQLGAICVNPTKQNNNIGISSLLRYQYLTITQYTSEHISIMCRFLPGTKPKGFPLMSNKHLENASGAWAQRTELYWGLYIHIRDMAREAILQGFLYKVRIKLVAAVCTLPLVRLFCQRQKSW